MLSLWLRPDAPADYLDELRYHLGMIDETPGELELGDLGVFSGDGGDYLPDGTVATLELAVAGPLVGDSGLDWLRARGDEPRYLA